MIRDWSRHDPWADWREAGEGVLITPDLEYRLTKCLLPDNTYNYNVYRWWSGPCGTYPSAIEAYQAVERLRAESDGTE